MKNTIEYLEKDDTSIKVFSDRWGIITSIKIKVTELLYQDMYDETLFDDSKSVKWWIPYMFPNAWPLNDVEKEKSWFKLPQHWTWRINKWEKIDSLPWEYKQKYNLKSSEIFPYEADVFNTIKIEGEWVNILHEVINNSDIELPISTWLHPYFRVPLWNKEDIEWNFKWWNTIKESVDIWSNDWTISFDNPWKPLDIFIPWLWNLIIEVSEDYKKFWVRSLPNKDFICIEPVMWNEWSIVNNPVIVSPWDKNINFMKIALK